MQVGELRFYGLKLCSRGASLFCRAGDLPDGGISIGRESVLRPKACQVGVEDGVRLCEVVLRDGSVP